MGVRKISMAYRLKPSEPSQPVLLVHPLSDGFMSILNMNAPHLQLSQTCPSSFPYLLRWICFFKPQTGLTKGIIWRDASDKENVIDEPSGDSDETKVSVHDVIIIRNVYVRADGCDLVTVLPPLHAIYKVGATGT